MVQSNPVIIITVVIVIIIIVVVVVVIIFSENYFLCAANQGRERLEITSNKSITTSIAIIIIRTREDEEGKCDKWVTQRLQFSDNKLPLPRRKLHCTNLL